MTRPARVVSASAAAALLAIITAPVLGVSRARAQCSVGARTSAGWVCGSKREADNGQVYASFRGVPYASQPLGSLRFKELQPPEPWVGYRDAKIEGPACPQTDIFYGSLQRHRGMSESCIHANIHVPIEDLPTAEVPGGSGLPILVFVHGGGFAFGSGDTDIHGPEHFVSKRVIVVTFNYRLNVFGFLSLNSTEVPGNNGLRDVITLLRWLQDNARFFGGDPDDVTLAGQSAGAVATHLLTLSPQAEGLFNKAIIMSGTAIPMFYTTSPAYAQFVAHSFVSALGINSTDPAEVHRRLVATPLGSLMAVNRALQDQFGITVFFPVIESPHPGVTPILAEDTELLLAKGYGHHIPLLIGMTNAECESFRKRFEEIDMISRINQNPLLVLSPQVTFKVPPDESVSRAMKIIERYGNGSLDMDSFLRLCSDSYFTYPALKVAEYRSKSGGAPAYMYQYSYNARYSPVKEALGLRFQGAGHVEDLTVVMQVNSQPAMHHPLDDDMTELMVQHFTNFIETGNPEGREAYPSWPPVNKRLQYQEYNSATDTRLSEPTPAQLTTLHFFDHITDTRPSTFDTHR